MSEPRIVIIGAGMAGIACARALSDAGIPPIVVDKGRSPGGRMSTRRVEGFAFDHGAQFFTARGAAFRAAVSSAMASGAVAAWEDGSGAEDPHHVGLPGMSGMVKHLVAGLDVRYGIEITSVRAADSGWVLEHADGTLEADTVICTAPLPQTRNLLGSHGMEAALAPVEMAPCWALLLGFEASFEPGWSARRSNGDLGWIAHDGSKPGRNGNSWVVHASPRWSREHLELSKEEATARLRDMLGDELGPLPKAAYAAAHRWRYAMVTKPLGQPFLHTKSLFAGGDWALGPRVECAFDSGHAIAKAVLES